MQDLTKRVRELREHALQWEENQNEYVGQYLYHALKGLEGSGAGAPWMRRKSNMLCSILRGALPVIHERELIVGYNYYGDDNAMWSERSLRARMGEERDQLARYLGRGRLDGGQIEYILDLLDGVGRFLPGMPYFSEEPAEYSEAFAEGVICAQGTSENHTVVGFEKVLRLGFSGISAEIAKMQGALDAGDPSTIQKKLLLECAKDVADSACLLGRRYREKAEEQLRDCLCGERRQELEKLTSVLANVPERPAETFREAVQSLWFAHIVNTWEDGINANSLGRLDQILYPYYKRDRELGRLDDDEALELICCLWIKLYREYDVQQAMLGGLTPQGGDGTNELTYLMLDATDALDFIRCLSVRLHKGSPMKLIRRSLEIVGKGRGIPFFFNDDILVPALAGSGVALEDARDYAAIGCVEITIPGRANPHAVSNRVNLLKCLELALNDGVSIVTGLQVGPRTGRIEEMTSLDDVIAAYSRQVEYFTGLACAESNRLELESSLSSPMPYKSMLTEGCLESGRDFNGGGAKYNYHESMPMGIPNVADSLAALEKLVFIEKRHTLAEAVGYLKENFPDEGIRLEFLNRAPKYGNDDDSVDRYAVMAMRHFHDVIKKRKSLNGQGFFMQPFTFLWLMEAGESTAATPDGRRLGENIAYSVSPMQGRDCAGLTAVFNSIAKLPAGLAAGSTSAIIEIDPALFEGNRIDLLTAMLRTAVEKGVGQVQFNVTNAETLQKAQAEPDKYRNLAVRVSGFSQRFCLLDRRLQDHIIARTKHKKL